MSNPTPSRITYPLIRKFHWGLVLACFFLPCVRGCNDEIVFPYQESLKDPIDWTLLFMFLYPLLFAVVAWIIKRLIKPSWQTRALWILLYLIGLGLTYVVAELIKDPSWREAAVFGSALVVLWGVVFLGLVRIKHFEGLMDLLGFTLSAFSLWLFPVGFLFAHEVLIGGWIFIFANSIILVTYALPILARNLRSLSGRRRRSSGSP